MTIDTVMAEILAGTAWGEHAADALHMCHAVALASFAQPLAEGTFWLGENPDVGRYEHDLRMAGLVLCPIFDPVKHEEYADYAEQMTQTRLGYAGIATDPLLQFTFALRVQALLPAGAFSSLEQARALRLWQGLRRQDAIRSPA